VAFAPVERAQELSVRANLTFVQALWATRAANVFTTHKPVASGFDHFDSAMVGRYLSHIDGLSDCAIDSILQLARAQGDDKGERYNMAYLAMRGSATCMAVSRLHGQVSRRIFQRLYPRWPPSEVPVRQITNGVHTPTSDSEPDVALSGQLCDRSVEVAGRAERQAAGGAEDRRGRSDARKDAGAGAPLLRRHGRARRDKAKLLAAGGLDNRKIFAVFTGDRHAGAR
jgi:starch phosphorylase